MERLPLLCLAVTALNVLILTHTVQATEGNYQDALEIYRTMIQKRHDEVLYLVTVEGYSLCGDGYCVCKDTKADCSGNLFLLKYFPKLPAGVRELNMSHNIGLDVGLEGVFDNITNITSLDLSFSVATSSNLSAAAFRAFNNLTELRLTGKPLSYSDFPAICLETLETLRLDACDLGPLPPDIFQENHMPRLRALYLRYNHLGPLNMSAFRPLVSLQDLWLDFNQIWKIMPDHLPELRLLSLTANPLSEMWDTCSQNGSLFPSLDTVLLIQTRLSGWGSQQVVRAGQTQVLKDLCLPNLQNLVLGNSGFIFLVTGLFRPSRFPALSYLNLYSQEAGIRFIRERAFSNGALASLDLRQNAVDFSAQAVDEESFAGCPNLTTLFLSGNDLSRVSVARFLRLFGHLVRLQRLDLSSTDIRNISADMFSPFTGLKTLELQSNRITVIPDSAFNSMAPDAKILLQDNQIEVVQEAAFSAYVRDNLSVLDLRRNPFRCGCELRWFRDWLAARPSLLQQQAGGVYSCANLPNTDVATFFVADQACLLSRQTSLLVIVTVVMVVGTFSTLSLVFRFRWYLRLVMYEAFRGRDLHQQRLQQRHFDYDVFVSYDSEDTTWVHKHLVPELEDGMQLRLCLHERDFIPGKHIVQNISDCVESSKKVMAIFSSDFARSPWCQFELDMCLSYAVENDDSLLVVLLRDVPPRDLTSAMRAVMKTTTYIEWGHGPDARQSFWRRLHIAVADLLPDN